jgi:replicative DNA helicase
MSNALAKSEKRQRVAGIIQADTEYGAVMKIADERNERATIGAVLQRPEVYPTVSEIVQAADFFFLKNGFYWHAIDTLSGRGESLDLISISSFMETLPNAPLQGDALIADLTDMMATCPDWRSAEEYARRVFNASLRIRLLKSTREIEAAALDKTITIDEVINKSDAILYQATNRVIEKPTDIHSAVSKYYDKVEQMLNSNTSIGIPYGFGELDTLLTGAYPGEVTIVAGSEGMGKTTWILSTMRNQIKNGRKVAIFSLEMTQEEITRNFIAMESGLYKDNLKAFKLSPQDWSKFVAASGDIAKWPLHVIDEFPTLTPVQLRRKLRKILMTDPVEAVFVDGLWLMQANEPTDDRPKDVFTIMRDLNIIARDFNIPLVVAHQYNGKASDRGDKKPTIFDIAESAGVRRNAQVIIGLYRESYYNPESVNNITEGYILKDRNGRAQGKHVNFGYNEQHSRFEDMKIVHIDL